MKAYLSNGILLADRDSAIVYGNGHIDSLFQASDTIKIKSSLLPLDDDIDVKNRKANFFLHFDHDQFDPTANTELYNSIKVEIGFNDGNGYCEDLYIETINRKYKLEHLSEELQKAIFNAIESEVDEYIKGNN